MAAGDHAATRYSGLNEINTGNANRLRVAWTFSTGVTAGHEAAPLVAGSTMFLVTPFPNLVYALDLTKPGELLRIVRGEDVGTLVTNFEQNQIA